MNTWKFILIDDNKLSNQILSDILLDAGYSNVIAFNTAISALEYLKTAENLYEHIIITDLIMPNMNGIELSKVIKSNKNFSDIPILMITSSNDISNLQEAFNAGVIDYILKPFNTVEILTRINSVLRLKREMLKRLSHEKSIEQLNKTLLDDLNIARHLQFEMLPQPVNLDQINIKGFYLPFMTLGGDLYYWEQIDEDRFGVILLDIMGHGTATSMITMYIRSILPKVFKKYTTPIELIKYLNNFIIDFNSNLNDIEYHCSAFYIIFDTKNKTAEYVNAGHPPLAFIQNDKKIKLMDKGCPPLGIFKDITILNELIPYDGNCYCVTYSDGMFELLKTENINIDILNLKFVDSYDKFLKNETEPLENLFKEIENMNRLDDVSLVLIKL